MGAADKTSELTLEVVVVGNVEAVVKVRVAMVVIAVVTVASLVVLLVVVVAAVVVADSVVVVVAVRPAFRAARLRDDEYVSSSEELCGFSFVYISPHFFFIESLSSCIQRTVAGPSIMALASSQRAREFCITGDSSSSVTLCSWELVDSTWRGGGG